jgi:hypothetical protein
MEHLRIRRYTRPKVHAELALLSVDLYEQTTRGKAKRRFPFREDFLLMRPSFEKLYLNPATKPSIKENFAPLELLPPELHDSICCTLELQDLIQLSKTSWHLREIAVIAEIRRSRLRTRFLRHNHQLPLMKLPDRRFVSSDLLPFIQVNMPRWYTEYRRGNNNTLPISSMEQGYFRGKYLIESASFHDDGILGDHDTDERWLEWD